VASPESRLSARGQRLALEDGGVLVRELRPFAEMEAPNFRGGRGCARAAQRHASERNRVRDLVAPARRQR
jgi:hypothetical protein